MALLTATIVRRGRAQMLSDDAGPVPDRVTGTGANAREITERIRSTMASENVQGITPELVKREPRQAGQSRSQSFQRAG